MAEKGQGEEIESLYVSFGGDGTGYEKMLDDSVVNTGEAATDMVKILDQAAKRIEQEFKHQAKTFSMTAREAEIFRLQLAGATDEQLKAARAANDTLTVLEKEQAEFEQFNNLQNEVKGFTSTLQAQSRTFGMNSRQVEIYRLAMAGASKADVQAMLVLDKKLTRLEKQQTLMNTGKSLTREMATSTEKFSARQKELNELLAAGAINADTYKRAMEDAKKQLGTGWDKIAAAMNPTNNAITTIGRNIQSLGRSYSMYVTAPVVAFGALSVNEFAKFDDAMTGSFAIMGNIDDMMKNKLSKTVRDLSASGKTMFDPDQLASGLKGLAAAGLSATQSMGSLEVVERFATAGTFGLDRATQLLLDSQSALGMVEKDAIKNKENLWKVSDALIKAGDQSTASPEQFAEALANGAADAKNFGMELGTVMAVLDAYASKGNKGAAAGSDLARATRLISKAVRENGEVFKKMGIDPINQATGEYKNFIDIVGEMENAFKGLTGPERSAMLELMGFEALAQSAILPLIGMSDQMKIWEKEQQSATDYTKNVAAVQMKSFTKEMQALWSQLKETGIGIGEFLVPSLKFLGDSLSSTLELWRQLPGPIQGTAIALVGVVAIGGPLLLMFGTGVLVAGQFSIALTALGLSSTAAAVGMKALSMASPVGWMIAAATAGFALGRAIDLNVGWTAHWNAELEKAITLSGQLISKMDEISNRRNGETITKANAMSNPDEKRAFLTSELDMANKNVSGLASQVQGAFKRVDDLSTAWNTMVDPSILNTAKAELKEVENNLEQARKRAGGLKTALDEMGPAAAKGATVATNAIRPMDIELDELTKKLEEQIATFKNSTEEAKIYELRMNGATDAQLKNVVALNDQLKAKKAEQKQTELMAKFDDDLKQLKAEEAMYGKGTRAIEIYKMKLNGASSAHISQAEAIDANLTKLEGEKKAREKIATFKDDIVTLQAQAAAFGQGSRAIEIYKMKMMGASDEQIQQAEALNKTLTALEKQKKAQEKATEITKKHAPPQERFNLEQKELQDLLDQGLISMETYRHALLDVYKEVSKDYTVEFKVGGVEAVAAGSAEAIAQMQGYLATKGQLSGPGKKSGINPNGPVPDFQNGLAMGDFKPKSKGGLTPLQQRARERALARKNRGKKDENLASEDFFRPSGMDVDLPTPELQFPSLDMVPEMPVALETPKPFDMSMMGKPIEMVKPSANPNAGLPADTAAKPTEDLKVLLVKIEENTRPDSSKPTVIFKPSNLRK